MATTWRHTGEWGGIRPWAWAGNVILALLILGDLSRPWWPGETPLAVEAPAPAAPPRTPPPRSDAHPAAAWFAPAPGHEAPASGAPLATTLNARLVGVIDWERGAGHSLALIQQGGRVTSYRVGESLGGQAVTVRAIHAEEVLLHHRGRLERLPLSRDTSSGGEPPPPRQERPAQEEANGGAEPEMPEENSEPELNSDEPGMGFDNFGGPPVPPMENEPPPPPGKPHR